MPIDELTAFRSRYPQYNDLSDLDLARSLGQKYPAYKDLEAKVTAQQAPVEEPTNYLKEAAKLAVRLGPPILVGATGYGIPAVAATAAGSEAAAQYLFGEGFKPSQIALQGVLGAIPGIKATGITHPLERLALKAA